jgi:hypothetical protein
VGASVGAGAGAGAEGGGTIIAKLYLLHFKSAGVIAIVAVTTAEVELNTTDEGQKVDC